MKKKLPKNKRLIMRTALANLLRTAKKDIDLGNIKNYKKAVLVIAFMLIGAVSAFSEPNYNAIVDAIYKAEGSERAMKPFGILSVPCSGYDECRQICLNTVRNNYKRWLKSDRSLTYLEFLSKRYAPIGVSNDPQGLNKNWLRNVKFFLEGK